VQHSEQGGIFSITDAGPGIREEDVSRVFTRGGKLSARPTAGEPSTGYGLAIAKDLIDALGGQIWFENEPTGGSTFSFSVPIYDSNRNSAR
jgi:two-component system sensor histidine kinase/response regulator